VRKIFVDNGFGLGQRGLGATHLQFEGGIVRKYLGVLVGAAALCVMSWAQAPAPTPTPEQTPAQSPAQTPAPTEPQTPEATPIPTPAKVETTTPETHYPRVELFGGGSYAEAGLFNAGHWAGLPGWDASLGLNATNWLGFVVEGGQYFGTSKIPTGTPAPFEPCPVGPCPGTLPTFDVATREYNVVFGLQFARRKYERWTPFAEALYGHQGTRGQVTAMGTFTEVGSGRALILGGGLDRKINERFALRFKADYFQTQSQFPTFGKQTQDNFRFSVGVVIRNVHKKKRRLEDETEPTP
jgi:hypothetical protein